MQPSHGGVFVTALMGIIVFKSDRRHHSPSQDGRLRSPAEAALRQVLNEAAEQQELSPLPLEGMCPPQNKMIWKNSIYTLSSCGLGDQQRAG